MCLPNTWGEIRLRAPSRQRLEQSEEWFVDKKLVRAGVDADGKLYSFCAVLRAQFLPVDPDEEFLRRPHHDGAGRHGDRFRHHSPMRALGVNLLALDDKSDVMVARSNDDVAGLIRQVER
jgi:hypothetical protein